MGMGGVPIGGMGMGGMPVGGMGMGGPTVVVNNTGYGGQMMNQGYGG